MSKARLAPRRAVGARVIGVRFVVAMRVRGGKKNAGRRATPGVPRGGVSASLCRLRGRYLPRSVLLAALEKLAERHHHPVVPLAQQRGEDVLADPLAPQMVAAVAA